MKQVPKKINMKNSQRQEFPEKTYDEEGRLHLKDFHVIKGLSERLDCLEAKINKINERVCQMANTLDQILDKVGEIETVGDSAIVLLRGLKEQLDAALAGGLSPAIQAKYDAIFDRLEAQKSEIGTAILETTPQAPTEPLPTPTEVIVEPTE